MRVLTIVGLLALILGSAVAAPLPTLRHSSPPPSSPSRAHQPGSLALEPAQTGQGFCGTRLEAVLDLIRLREASPATQPFPTPNSTDVGEIAVLEDDGTFFISDAVGHPLVDPAAVSRAFYLTHGDDYDYLAVYLATGLSDWLGSSGALAAAYVIRNDIQGIGLGTYDLGPSFNAPPNLQTIMKMNGLHRYLDDPFEEFPNDSLNGLEVLAHEMAHRWVCYTWLDSAGSTVPALLGRAYQHWNFFLDADASIMEGCDWSEVAPDSFLSVAVLDGFSALDQYLMGLRTPAELDSFFVINGPADIEPPGDYVPWSIPYVGIGLNGTATWWTLDDIEAVNGPRNPASTTGPDTVSVAFVLVTAQGQAATPADLQKVEAYRTALPPFWDGATAGRGFVNPDLQSRAGQVCIGHTPLKDTEDSLSTRPITAEIRVAQGGIPISVDPSSAKAYWRAATSGSFTELPMAPAGPDTFTAILPALPGGGIAQYYLYASSDSIGIDAYDPPAGAGAPHAYMAGADLTPPTLLHTPVSTQGESSIPQALLAQVDDNVGADSVWVIYGNAGGPLTSTLVAVEIAPDSFEVDLAPGLADGASVDYQYLARDAAGHTTWSPVHRFNVGLDLLYDFENGADGFTHLTVSTSYRDAWHMTTEDAAPMSPGTSWKCGGAPGDLYPAHLDCYLYMPWIPSVELGTTLQFEHRYGLEETSVPPYAWDGAWVEAWTSLTGWQPLAPAGGYSHQFWANEGPFVNGAPCWSGSSGGWVSESLDLSAYAGGAVLVRFHMLADEFIADEGWFVDHVRVDYPSSNLSVEPRGTALALGPVWPNPARTVLRQSVTLPRPARVTWSLFDVAGRRVATLFDGPVAPGSVSLEATLPASLRSGLYFVRFGVDGDDRPGGRVVVLR